jgi:hypothetical protein
MRVCEWLAGLAVADVVADDDDESDDDADVEASKPGNFSTFFKARKLFDLVADSLSLINSAIAILH